MRGTNPFEKHAVVETLRDPPQAPIDKETLPVEEPPAQRPDLTHGLITGELYEDLLVHAGRTGHKSPELRRQDELDDLRFEHLHGEDWKDLDDHEDMVRAARAIARREGHKTDESHAAVRVEMHEQHEATESKKRTLKVLLGLWTALGAVACGLEAGPLAFIFGGVTFFAMGAFGLWVVSLLRGMGSVSGRAV